MPNRIIKESICTSESIDQLTWFEEVFFYRLIVNCDDYGRMDARPAILKSRLFALKDITLKQIEGALNKLSTVGMVLVYEYDHKPYLQLVSWKYHQQIRTQKSKYPSPDEADRNCNQLISNDIRCPRNPIQSESESESNIGGLRLPPNPPTEELDNPPKDEPGDPPKVETDDPPKKTKFIPPTLEEVTAYIQERGSPVDPVKFFNHYKTVNWYRGKTKIQDWKACVITWEKTEKESAPKGGSGKNESSWGNQYNGAVL
jgi:hypothetical protein